MRAFTKIKISWQFRRNYSFTKKLELC